MRRPLEVLLLSHYCIHHVKIFLPLRRIIEHLPALRSYSSQSPRPIKFFPSKTPSLDHFLLRQQSLTLYRSIIRSCNRLPDPQAKKEMRSHARAEFERQKEVMDTRKIRYLLSTGRAEWKKLAGMFGGELPF